MMTRDASKNREQIQLLSLDDLVPQNHLVRKLEAAIDWSFIYDLVEEKYSENTGRPSLDPVTLIKLPILQYMFGIRSMRQTVKEVEVNAAYRWFLGLDLQDPVPHFSTFGKNYTRRFKDTDLFEQIFQNILSECFKAGLVDSSVVFVDSTHVKARANSKKFHDEIATEQAQWYEKELQEEINRDRAEHGKKPLKELEEAAEDTDDDDDSNDETPPSAPKSSAAGKLNPNTSKKKKARRKKEKHCKVSKSDPESGWFRKGEHKHVFAHSVQTACDRNGVVLGYSVHPGNENDGKTFPELMKKLGHLDIDIVVGDSAYKTPAIAKLLEEQKIKLLSAYKRPPRQRKAFSRRPSSCMTNSMTATSAPMIRCFPIPQQTERVTASTKAIHRSVQAARTCSNAPRARITRRPLPGTSGLSLWNGPLKMNTPLEFRSCTSFAKK